MTPSTATLVAVYAAIALSTTLLSVALTPMAISVARRRGWLDEPGGHKLQTEATPYLGGAAIVVAFVLAALFAAAVAPLDGARVELSVVVATGLALALVGLLDDLRGLGVAVRLVAEVSAGFVVWRSGIGADLFGGGWADAVVTIVWVVGIVNAVNLMDNMDGLSAGASVVAALSFFALASAQGQYLVAILAIALGGCAAGFLRHNRHPAQVYMGDAGSMFLGFMLAVIGIKLRFPGTPPALAALVPVLVLGVFIFDTTLVTATRLAAGRTPFSGGRDHTSHRLISLGLTVPVAVASLYVAAITCGWLALVLTSIDLAPGLGLAALVLSLGFGGGLLLARVPVGRAAPSMDELAGANGQ